MFEAHCNAIDRFELSALNRLCELSTKEAVLLAAITLAASGEFVNANRVRQLIREHTDAPDTTTDTATENRPCDAPLPRGELDGEQCDSAAVDSHSIDKFSRSSVIDSALATELGASSQLLPPFVEELLATDVAFADPTSWDCESAGDISALSLPGPTEQE